MRLTAISPILLLTLVYAPNAVVCAGCKTIGVCKANGQSIWKQIENAKDSDKAGISEQYARFYKGRETSSTIDTPTNIKDLMQGVNLPLPTKVDKVTIPGTRGPANSHDNIYSNQLIVAIRNNGNEDPVTPPVNRLHWNDIAFEQYKARKTSGSLTYVLSVNILNNSTVTVIDDVYAAAGKGGETKKDKTNWEKWTYNDQLLPLLGTAKGSGAGQILIDHAHTIGRKTIASIRTRRYNKAWAMVVKYQPRKSVTESFFASVQQLPIVRFVGGLLGA
jgi:hypothetical protein